MIGTLDRILFHQGGDLMERSFWIGGENVTNHDIRHFAQRAAVGSGAAKNPRGAGAPGS